MTSYSLRLPLAGHGGRYQDISNVFNVRLNGDTLNVSQTRYRPSLMTISQQTWNSMLRADTRHWGQARICQKISQPFVILAFE